VARGVATMTERAASVAGYSLTDEQVVERVLAGELHLFEVVMRRYNQRLYRVARSVVTSDSEAEDVVQDSYVRAYVHLSQFAGRSSFATWLTRIAFNEALARKRAGSRLVEIDSLEDGEEAKMKYFQSTAQNPEEQALTRSVGEMLETAVDSLPENYRSVFMLRDIEGLSTAETAQCLDLSEDTVKVRLHRGRTLLRREIYKRTGEAGSAAFQFAGARCNAIVAAVLARIAELSSAN
jgi:RNA polymerase sigma-70 factor (ECF subfamily)